MKKALSVLLAVTMILAMLPASFAADGDATAITYDFTSASRNQTGVAYVERHTASILAAFADYPEDDTDAKDQWFVLGNNLNYSGSNSSHPWMRINNGGHIYTKSGTNVWPSSTVGDTTVGEGWLAFQIYVPTAGIYDLSITAGGVSPASESVDIYIGKTTDILNKAYFTSEAVVGTKKGLTIGTDTNPYTNAVADNKTDRIREGAKKFSELGIPQDYLKASGISLAYDSATEIDIERQFVAEEAGDYILLLRNNETDTRLTIGYLTLTPSKLDKTHKYVFNNTVLTGDILENSAFTANYSVFYIPEGKSVYSGNYLDSYDNVDENLTDVWCVSLLGGKISSGSSYRKSLSELSKSGLDMATRRDMANSISASARFVLQLKVNYDGIYNITAEVGEFAWGTDADVYMIKTSEVTEINPTVLKNYKSIGRVGNVSGRADGDIGAASLTAGDWYIVFDFNTTNTTQTSSSARQIFRLDELTFTEIDALPESGSTPEAVEGEDIPEISFSATTSIPDKATVSINGVEGNLKILKPSIGDDITVSAPDVTGYKFVGWKAGVANNSGDGELANTAKFVKDLAQTDTFTVYTSTFLTAVYEETEPDESTASIVEFWNLDGSYLGNKTVDRIQEEGGLPTTSLIGHAFAGWLTEEDTALDIAAIVEKVTHAVADYTADAISGNGVRVNGTSCVDANAYGKEVVCTDSEGTVTHWIRDGKVVSYDKTYKYYVWDSTNIISSYAPIEKKPLVVLDGDAVSDAYMIEYDGAGKTIVEVGILFGTGTPTVGAKSEIFKSQRGDNHGQFAAKPSDSSYTARGYMIYEDTDGSYKVIYSE